MGWMAAGGGNMMGGGGGREAGREKGGKEGGRGGVQSYKEERTCRAGLTIPLNLEQRRLDEGCKHQIASACQAIPKEPVQ